MTESGPESFGTEFSRQPSGPCQNCKMRPATEWWVEEGGTLAWVHGMGQAWCKLCCLKKQIAHAHEVSRKLPKMYVEAARLELRPFAARLRDTFAYLMGSKR
jgi:hypothetical protein